MNLSTHNESIQETVELVARLTRRVVGIENKTETLQSHLVGINSKLDELMLTLVSEHLCAHSDEEWGRLWRCIIVLGSFVIICLHTTPSLVLTPPGVGLDKHACNQREANTGWELLGGGTRWEEESRNIEQEREQPRGSALRKERKRDSNGKGTGLGNSEEPPYALVQTATARTAA